MLLLCGAARLPLDGRFPGTDGVSMRKLHASCSLPKPGVEGRGRTDPSCSKARQTTPKRCCFGAGHPGRLTKHAEPCASAALPWHHVPKTVGHRHRGQARSPKVASCSPIEKLDKNGRDSGLRWRCSAALPAQVPPIRPPRSRPGQAIAFARQPCTSVPSFAQLRPGRSDPASRRAEIERAAPRRCLDPMATLGTVDGWAQRRCFAARPSS